MKCYNPRLTFVNPEGGRPIFTKYSWSQFIHWKNGYQAPTFPSALKDHKEPMKLACGRCEACRLEQARQKAVRCVHELEMHDGVGCFLTLTYGPDSLPSSGSYDVSDIVNFVKRLRKALGERKIKTFGCAEYGPKGLRPHFHLLVFGFDFPDRTYWAKRGKHGSGNVAYRSKMLDELWGLGHAELGTITPASASYVARYTQKKAMNNDLPEGLEPEKAVCVSRRPGIGASWFDKYHGDIYEIDAVVVSGRKQGIPRYYDLRLQMKDPVAYAELKKRREATRPLEEPNNSQDRMEVRKVVHQQQIKKLKRSFENED